MDEIIRVKNVSYARYEELLMRRDNVRKEAFIAQRDYVAEFGDLILEVFEKKIECIRMKKAIEYCQASLNYGKVIDQETLQEYLLREMAAFQDQLDAMIEDTQSAKDRSPVSEMDMLKIRRIYRRLVKKIHPDINPLTEEDPILSDLWQRVQIAYNCNNLKELEELQVLVESALEAMNIDGMEIDIADIEEKIAELEEEIIRIKTTDPYLYRELLDDPQAVEEKKADFKRQLKEYEDYLKQLEDIFESIMESGVSFTWRMN